MDDNNFDKWFDDNDKLRSNNDKYDIILFIYNYYYPTNLLVNLGVYSWFFEKILKKI